jgi:hypothetical protein
VNTNHPADRIASHGALDGLLLGAVLVILGAVIAMSLATSTAIWRPDSQPQSLWCLPDQTPRFSFGFADLAQHLGNIMGEPTECEHGEIASNNTFQRTTTGLAVYDWCTNTPSFVRGHDHWMIAPGGVVYWLGSDDPPEPRSTVRNLDLRHPCPP